MGVTAGNTGDLGGAGAELERLTEQEPKLPPITPRLNPLAPISGRLAFQHNGKANNAATFASAKDAGIAAAGRALRETAAGYDTTDDQNAQGIRRSSSAPEPGAGGGQ